MQSQIVCLTSAGPTPGNSDFASYFNSQLGPSTTRFWNTLDVVPHVWNAPTLLRFRACMLLTSRPTH